MQTSAKEQRTDFEIRLRIVLFMHRSLFPTRTHRFFRKGLKRASNRAVKARPTLIAKDSSLTEAGSGASFVSVSAAEASAAFRASHSLASSAGRIKARMKR